MRHILLTSAVIAMCATPALAQDGDSPLSGLYKCADIEQPDDRLACYDAAVGNIKTAEEKKEIVTIDTEKARSLRREAFGFNLPSLPDLGIISEKEAAEPLIVAVKNIKKVGRTYYIYLENGQVWKDSEQELSRVPRGDLSASIEPAMMSSFKMTLSSDRETIRGLRVKRVE